MIGRESYADAPAAQRLTTPRTTPTAANSGCARPFHRHIPASVDRRHCELRRPGDGQAERNDTWPTRIEAGAPNKNGSPPRRELKTVPTCAHTRITHPESAKAEKILRGSTTSRRAPPTQRAAPSQNKQPHAIPHRQRPTHSRPRPRTSPPCRPTSRTGARPRRPILETPSGFCERPAALILGAARSGAAPG